jgi:hypothetical protein
VPRKSGPTNEAARFRVSIGIMPSSTDHELMLDALIIPKGATVDFEGRVRSALNVRDSVHACPERLIQRHRLSSTRSYGRPPARAMQLRVASARILVARARARGCCLRSRGERNGTPKARGPPNGGRPIVAERIPENGSRRDAKSRSKLETFAAPLAHGAGGQRGPPLLAAPGGPGSNQTSRTLPT